MSVPKFVKVFLSIFLVVAMTAAFAACSTDTPDKPVPTAEQSSNTEKPVETQGEEATPADTEGPADATEAPTEGQSEETEAPSEEATEAATEEQAGDTAAPTEAPTAAPTETPADTPAPEVKEVDFTVARVFSSNMVVQRGEPVVVWGFADEQYNGGKVYGEFMGVKAEGTVKDGRWEMVFNKSFEANASMGNNMRFYSGRYEQLLSDVLIGDVYMVIGQSNAAYTMSNHWLYMDKNDVDRCSQNANFDYPIRIQYHDMNTTNGIARGTAETAKDIRQRNSWKVAKKGSITNFSAIGYMFAWNYCRMTDSKVPIGMIEINGNGLPLGSFVPNEVADKHKTDTYDAAKGYYKTTGVNSDGWPWGRFMYNEYMAPLEGMAMAGILWYQGESDMNDREANRYANVYVDMMNYIRSKHNTNNKNMPVYFVEFPTQYNQSPNFKPSDAEPFWAFMNVGKIRGMMGSMVLRDSNMYQIQSSDVWADKEFWNTLHPNCKYEQALRAAKIACAVKGEGGVAMSNASGPIVESVTFSADKKTATIKYKNVGDGLKTVDGSNKVKGYTWSGVANRATSVIEGTITGKDTVVVTTASAMGCLGYNCIVTYYFGTEINLCNSAGIPAGAFMVNS